MGHHIEICPYCKKPVEFEWSDKGLVSRPEITVIADWVYHSECWDKQIEEHPP